MKFKILSLDEHADGSATAQVDMDEETKDLLINIGFRTLIKDAMELEKQSKFEGEPGDTP
jgi:hypothetical protein